jgi:glycine C-acetyltransferase
MSKKFYSNLEEELRGLKQEGTYKKLQHLQSALSSKTKVEGFNDVIVLCSNNYLGLADKPEIIEAGISALEKYGAGAASVRFICGTYDIHRNLESKIADFLGTEAALTYTSCWAANTAIIPALLKSGDSVTLSLSEHSFAISGSLSS